MRILEGRIRSIILIHWNPPPTDGYVIASQNSSLAYLHITFLLHFFSNKAILLLRPSVMEVLNVAFKHMGTLQWCVENCWRMMWRKEMLNAFNMLNLETWGTAGAFRLAKTRACNALADRGEWSGRSKREKMQIG